MSESEAKESQGSLTEPASDDVKVADDNIRRFVDDLSRIEPPLTSIGMRRLGKEEGRDLHPYAVSSTLRAVRVEMPALPLWKIRYTARKGQSRWSFTDILVDGIPYAWKYAVEVVHDKLSRGAR